MTSSSVRLSSSQRLVPKISNSVTFRALSVDISDLTRGGNGTHPYSLWKSTRALDTHTREPIRNDSDGSFLRTTSGSSVFPRSSDSARTINSIGSTNQVHPSADAMVYISVHDKCTESQASKSGAETDNVPYTSRSVSTDNGAINISITLSHLRAIIVSRFIEELAVFLLADQIWPSIHMLIENLKPIEDSAETVENYGDDENSVACGLGVYTASIVNFLSFLSPAARLWLMLDDKEILNDLNIRTKDNSSKETKPAWNANVLAAENDLVVVSVVAEHDDKSSQDMATFVAGSPNNSITHRNDESSTILDSPSGQSVKSVSTIASHATGVGGFITLTKRLSMTSRAYRYGCVLLFS